MEEFYNLTEASSMLRISKITLRRFIRARKIGFYRIGSKYFLTEENIKQYLKSVEYPIKEVK